MSFHWAWLAGGPRGAGISVGWGWTETAESRMIETDPACQAEEVVGFSCVLTVEQPLIHDQLACPDFVLSAHAARDLAAST